MRVDISKCGAATVSGGWHPGTLRHLLEAGLLKTVASISYHGDDEAVLTSLLRWAIEHPPAHVDIDSKPRNKGNQQLLARVKERSGARTPAEPSVFWIEDDTVCLEDSSWNPRQVSCFLKGRKPVETAVIHITATDDPLSLELLYQSLQSAKHLVIKLTGGDDVPPRIRLISNATELHVPDKAMLLVVLHRYPDCRPSIDRQFDTRCERIPPFRTVKTVCSRSSRLLHMPTWAE